MPPTQYMLERNMVISSDPIIPENPGIIGVETRLPLMSALVNKKVLSMGTFLRTNIVNAAEAYGIQKGKIETGYDADFIVCTVRPVVPNPQSMPQSFLCGASYRPVNSSQDFPELSDLKR